MPPFISAAASANRSSSEARSSGIRSSRGRTGRGFLLVLLILCCCTILPAQQETALVTVNGTPITQARLELFLQNQGIPREDWPAYQERGLELLIDRLLIQQHLDARQVTAPTATLERQLALIDHLLQQGKSPEETLQKLGMTREQLQKELALPLAWKRYVRQVVTEAELADYFQRHRKQLDGTKRKAAQIFLPLKPTAEPAEEQVALARLEGLRSQVLGGELTFAEAARQHSQAPSAEKGGEIGTFAFTGQMPVPIAEAVFKTAVGEMSIPFRSPLGAHLVFVEEEIPGQFSLEDVRTVIFDRLADELWATNVTRLRKTARINTR